MADDMKKFSVLIEPAYVGVGKEKRLETIIFARILTPKGNYEEFQGIVPPKSRLDQELKKILDLSKQKDEKKLDKRSN